MDFETETTYNVIITATDGGTPSLSTSVFVAIAVVDENDNAPRFASQSNSATIPENSLTGALVADLGATDADSGSNSQLSYSIVGGGPSAVFQIDPTTGMVLVQNSLPLDFEAQRMFVVQVQAEDRGVPPMSSSTLVNMLVDKVCYQVNCFLSVVQCS